MYNGQDQNKYFDQHLFPRMALGLENRIKTTDLCDIIYFDILNEKVSDEINHDG